MLVPTRHRSTTLATLVEVEKRESQYTHQPDINSSATTRIQSSIPALTSFSAMFLVPTFDCATMNPECFEPASRLEMRAAITVVLPVPGGPLMIVTGLSRSSMFSTAFRCDELSGPPKAIGIYIDNCEYETRELASIYIPPVRVSACSGSPGATEV